MNIRMNDEPVQLDDDSTLADLCERFELRPGGVVISVNGRVVPKTEYGSFVLQEASQVEVMVFVGGG